MGMADRDLACCCHSLNSDVLHLRAEFVGEHVHDEVRACFAEGAEPVKERPADELSARAERECAPTCVKTYEELLAKK